MGELEGLQLFSNVGRPRSFLNVISTNSTLDPERTVGCFCNCSYVNMKFGSVRSDHIKLFFLGGGGELIFETNCIFEYKPSPTLG